MLKPAKLNRFNKRDQKRGLRMAGKPHETTNGMQQSSLTFFDQLVRCGKFTTTKVMGWNTIKAKLANCKTFMWASLVMI